MMLKRFANEKAMKWLGRVLGILLAIALFWFMTPLRMAYAAPTPPPYTTSWYMDTTDPTTLPTAAYNMGCTLGTHDKNTAGTQDNVVILLFGKPAYSNGYGTKAWIARGNTNNFVFLSTAQIADAVEQFGRGYYQCTLSDTTSQVYVAAGTSNFNDGTNNVTYAHGSAWATMTNGINSWISTNGYSSQVKVRAASDMELDFNNPTPTRAWVDGYTASYGYNSLYLYDVGNATGCPYPGQPNWDCGSVSYPSWTSDDVRYVSWGTTPLYPLPEIYNTAGVNSGEWYYLSLYSYNNYGGPLYFIGSLTEYQACQQFPPCTGINNTPSTGWTQLWNAITSDSRTYQSTLRWSTDMMWR